MKQALLFDCYGTLISTGTGSMDAVRRMLQRRNTQADPAAFYAAWKQLQRQVIAAEEAFVTEEEVFRRSLRQLYKQEDIAGNADDDIVMLLETLGKRTAFPEAHAALDALRGTYRIYIASTTDDAPLASDLARNQLRVDGMYTSESLRVYKPHASFYEQILADLLLSPAEVWFIGDSREDDVCGPQTVGIDTIWVNRKQEPWGSSVPGPVYEVVHLLKLLPLLLPVSETNTQDNAITMKRGEDR